MTKAKKPAAKRAAAKKTTRAPAAKKPKKAELLLINRSVPGKKTVAPSRIRAPKKAVPTEAGNKYAIQVKRASRGQWQSIGMGGNSLEAVKQVARMYANNYPNYAFRVV